MSARTEAVGTLGEDVAVMYRLWYRLGLALLCAAQAYGGRAEAIHEEAPGLPQLQEAAQALGVQLHEAHEAVLWLLGEGPRRGEGELARVVGVMAALLTGLPALFKQVLCLPLARRAAHLLRENGGGGTVSEADEVQEALVGLVMGRVRTNLQARFAAQPPDERARSVWAEQERLRKGLRPDLARVELEQPGALAALADRLCATLLDRLQRHPERARFIEELRAAADQGASDRELARLASGLLAGKVEARALDAERDLAQRLSEADQIAEDLGLSCKIVPREVGAPPAQLLVLTSETCPDREQHPSSSCGTCRLWRPCPSGTRRIVPRVVGDWFKKLGQASTRCHRKLPGVLSPWLLVPGG